MHALLHPLPGYLATHGLLLQQRPFAASLNRGRASKHCESETMALDGPTSQQQACLPYQLATDGSKQPLTGVISIFLTGAQ